MKKKLSFIGAFLFLFSCNILFSQTSSDTLFFENFENEIDSAWIFEDYWEVGTPESLSGGFFEFSGEGQVVALNDHILGEDVIVNSDLVMPPLDLTGLEHPYLEFDSYFGGAHLGAQEKAKVLISRDNGMVWNTQEVPSHGGSWRHVQVSLEEYGNETILIAFEYDDGGSQNLGWAIDDVIVRKNTFARLQGPFDRLSLYTMLSRRQVRPFDYEATITNTGNTSIEDIEVEFNIFQNQEIVHTEASLANFLIDEATTISYSYLPTDTGSYQVHTDILDPDAESISYLYKNFRLAKVSETTMARDDNERDVGLGFGFFDPSWYGYYGSEFVLIEADTLTNISVFINPNSETGTINFTVNAFEENNPIPELELYHSAPVKIGPLQINNWVNFQLPEPLALPAGRYVFAAGQDSLQGNIGFGFDNDNIYSEGYWDKSPVVSGGYPWKNSPLRETLMIRPHFKPVPVAPVVSSTEIIVEDAGIKIQPNPFQDKLIFEVSKSGDYQVYLRDLNGRILMQEQLSGQQMRLNGLSTLPKGVYVLEVLGADSRKVEKVIKH